MMKRKLTVLILALAAVLSATTIRDIQYTTAENGDSPLNGQSVTVSAEVTAEPYAYGGRSFYIQDANEPWSGINVFHSSLPADILVAEGDWITITGTVTEYYGKTEITDITALTVDSVAVFKMKPQVVTTGELADSTGAAEQWEGVLVRVKNVDITNGDAGFGQWLIDDGSGEVMVDDVADYYFWPAEYDNCLSVTGPLDYTYSQFKIIPRLAFDIIEGNKTGEAKIYTRIQRMQQVRYSDLVRTPEDINASDSYLSREDTTIVVKGVVTMPTGLSYAGDGVKFIMADEHGGPWSAILSYNADASLYPNMTEGFLIEMSGYIGEYVTAPAAMTEFWLVGDVEVIEIDQPTPEPSVVTTGDLRWPTTAEQWGNVMVTIEDAVVVDTDPQYEIMGIDDGSGMVLVDDDSDSLGNYVTPPRLTPLESITGWVYHHYGSYADSSTYKLCPLYEEDIVMGEGPAMIMNVKADPAGIASSTETVDVSATLVTVRTIVDAAVYYRVDQGDYMKAAMTEGLENVWTATIPAQAAGSFVDYYFSVEDDSADVSLMPADITLKNYSYLVLDSAPEISDIQYTHWANGASPLVGAKVAITGVIQTPSDPWVNRYTYHGLSYLSIASAAGQWNGIYVGGAPDMLLDYDEGVVVTAYGTVTEDFDASYWRWQHNTTIALDSIKYVEETDPIQPVLVTTGELAADPESYEGTLVTVNNVEITGLNQYDLTIDDGSGGFLLDDDAADTLVFRIFYQDGGLIGNTYEVTEGSVIDRITGVVIYSYGTFKIEVRNAGDIEFTPTSVDESTLADRYVLRPNYPNPFNPVTNLSFDLPKTEHVTVHIYNLNGQLIRTLGDRSFQAGTHSLVWDGRNEANAPAASGLYLYRFQAGDFSRVSKMTLLK